MINQYLVDGIIIKKRKEAVSEIRKILTVNLSSCLDTNVLWHRDPHIDLKIYINVSTKRQVYMYHIYTKKKKYNILTSKIKLIVNKGE